MGFKYDNYATPTHRGHNPYLQESLNKLSDREKETLEEGYERIYNSMDFTEFDFASFKLGAEWQQERTYSEEEVKVIVNKVRETGLTVEYLLLTEQFKKKKL